MLNLGLQVDVRDFDNELPVQHAMVFGYVVCGLTNKEGVVVLSTVLVSVTAPGYEDYLAHPYVAPTLDTPIIIRLVKKPQSVSLPFEGKA